MAQTIGQSSDIMDHQDIHLLVVDDDDRIRSLLRSYLGKRGFRVSTVGNTTEARQLMGTLAFDLLIVDVMMPGETGFEFTRTLRESDDIPVILLTARGEADDRIEGLKTGADDYLPKPFEPEELVLRIDAIFRRIGTTAPASQVSFGPYIFDLDRQLLAKNGDRVKLTTGEEVMLTMLARRAGVAVSRHALSETINAQSERAVDVQMTRLRRKIEDTPSEPDYLLTVRGQGYRLVTDSPDA
ncbi:response regulator [Fretibacter rubidus]|uniref:response regulator n=1 Tax=Fretibacter rubidus TaxID=570162 RepID=UPI00352A987B